MNYTQNYNLFWLVVIGYVVVCFGLVIPIEYFTLTATISLALIMLTTLVFIEVLLYTIYRGEFVYWINNGPTFKEASAMSSEERRAYARLFLKSYHPYFVAGVLITLLFMSMSISSLWLVVIVSIIILAWALSTLRFSYRARKRR